MSKFARSILYWILLAPLSAGAHTIHFTAHSGTDAGGDSFSIDVTYELTVQ